jgi:hypothetical protein
LAAVMFLTGIILPNRPVPAQPVFALLDGGYNGEAAVTYDKTSVYAGPVNIYNTRKIKNYFFDRHIRRIDAIVLTEFSGDDAPRLRELVNLFRPKYVYVPVVEKVTDYGKLMDACAYSKLITVRDAADRPAGNMRVRLAVDRDRLIGVNIEAAGQNICVMYEKNTDNISRALWMFPDDVALLAAHGNLLETALIKSDNFIQCYNYMQFMNEARGNFTYNLDSGIIGFDEVFGT